MYLNQIKGQNYSLNLEVSVPEQTISALLIYENTEQEQTKVIDSDKNVTQNLVPYNIFKQGLSGLQAIVKYLVEQKNMSYAEISKITNRDQRTIWNTYNQTKKIPKITQKTQNQKTEKITKVTKTITRDSSKKEENLYFDLNNIKNRNIAVLENICLDLKNKGYTLTESGLILNKSPKTIWTALNRIQIKRGDQK